MGEVSSSSTSNANSGGGNGGALTHVLVIDDSLIDRKVVEKLLKSSMFTVTTVDSGKRAIDILGLGKEKIGTSVNINTSLIQDLKIDIILTDYCMPGMNGYDVLKAVKEDSCLKSMPVAIMSSEHDPQRISRCFATGAEDFISKPLQLKDIQRLRSYVRPTSTIAKASLKRKMQLELMPENKGSERRSCIASVAVA